MKKWNIVSNIKNEDIVKILLENRGLKTKEEIDSFLNPRLEDVTIDSVGIDKKQLQKAVKRIQKAIEKKGQIVVFGDYDVDGICGTAILWETLYALDAKVMPYIPHRVDEGYGLSIKGITSVQQQITNISLIITVDNGIVAHKAVSFAKKQGIDVIITDHHTRSDKLPDAFVIVHTTKLCGAGVGWMLSKEIKNGQKNDHLGLVALATVADLVPLVNANRTLTKYGLEVLRATKRPGLLALLREAVIDQKTIDTYHIGHMIGPRLNASGRLEYAMDSLRLVCTKDAGRAQVLAEKLGSTNRDRQQLTFDLALHAKELVMKDKKHETKLLFIAHESYSPGIIGLIASRLVEEFYRPAIVLSIGETYSKASARSIAGFNIIEFIRTASEHLVDAGGHPMAAGFTVETQNLALLEQSLAEKIHEVLDEALLTQTLTIDCELDLSLVSPTLYEKIQQLSPFGMGNPEPVFVSKEVVVAGKRIIGKDARHVKFQFGTKNSEFRIEGVGFGLAEKTAGLKIGDSIDIAYTIDENKWNGNTVLQLKIKDIIAPLETK